MGQDRLIGPGLKDITKKRDREWLVKWITNSQEFIKSGDKEAIKLWEDWKPTVMTPFYFSDEEFDALFAYLENPPVEENIAIATNVLDNESEKNNMHSLLLLLASLLVLAFILVSVKNSLKSSLGQESQNIP